ncbi:MAG: hypothetical protein LUC24_03690 [Bacteroidales bacterium]|nr:hypothetical protein [Bacteroidales bacterium]
MRADLSVFGNVPVSAATVESLFPDLAGKNRKLRQLERDGEIIRLKRGLYVVRPQRSDRPLSTELIANHIYAPSYVSKSSALRYYGLIPEAVYTIQSMTVKQSRSFDTVLGRFDYSQIGRDVFHVGIRSVVDDGIAFMMASPEKALCDLIGASTGVWLRYLKDVRSYLEDDIRLDMDAFMDMDIRIFEEYASVGGKKADSIRTLIKFLQNEQSALRHSTRAV